MKVALLTIGDELLIGQVLNSNAQWLSQRLTEIGVTVTKHLTVGDSKDAIQSAFDTLQHEDALIVGGGLGPTHDDITMEVLSSYFNIPLFYDEEWISKVEAYFQARNRPMSPNNKKQAYLLQGATRIDNQWGTAAGQYFKTQNRHGKSQEIFVVPGVPHEMKAMAQDFILPLLQKKNPDLQILKKTILVTGIGESALALKCTPTVDKIKSLKQNGEDITLAFLPSATEVRMRLQWAITKSDDSKIKTFENLIQDLVQNAGNDFFGFEPQKLEELLIQKLSTQNKTVAIAESCTGGLIAHRLTQIPGASKVLRGSLIAYQNLLKESELQISPAFIKEHGVVSEAVAKEMALSIRKKWKTDFGVSSTGFLGPDGGDEHAPIGTVWVAVATQDTCVTKMLTFENHRERNKERGAQAALDLLRRHT